MDISKLAGGAVAERIDQAWEQVLRNILDPNTDPKKARKLTIELTATPGIKRDMTTVEATVKLNLQPAVGIETTFMFGVNGRG